MSVIEGLLSNPSRWVRRFAALSPDPVFVLDSAGEFLYISPAVEAVVGYTPDDLVDTHFVDLLDEEAQIAALDAFERVLDGETIRGLELPVQAFDDTTVHLDVTATPIETDEQASYVYAIARDVTTDRRREQQLQLYERAIATAPIGISITDAGEADDPLIYANPAFEELTGYETDDILGRNCRFLQGDDTDPATVAQMRTAIDAASPVTVEILNYRYDETPWWNRVTIAPIRNETGNITHHIGFQEDVTEQVEQNQELERQVDLFEKAQDIADVGAWEYDVRTGEHWGTHKIKQIHGVSENISLLPQESPQFYHPDDRETVETAFKRASDDGESYDVTVRFIDASGSQKWVRSRGEPHYVDGDLQRIRGTLQDVTEQIEQAQEIERQAELFEWAQDIAEFGLIDWDLQTGEVDCSEELCHRFGLPSDEQLTIDDLEATMHPDDKEQIQAALNAAITGESPYNLEHRNVRPDGKVIWTQNQATLVHNDEGEPQRLVGLVSDITERKTYERELEWTNELLETLIEELPAGVLAESEDRKIAIANQQLVDLFGVPDATDQLIGADCTAVADDLANLFADPSAFMDGIKETIAAGDTVIRERLDLADGQVFERSYAPTEFPDGMGHLWVYRDVTDQCRREQDLRRFQKAVEQAGTAIYITDTDGTIEYVNPAFEQITGYSSEEAIGADPSLLNSGEYDTSFFEELWTTIEAGQVWEETIIDQTSQGEQYTALQTIAPISDDTGELTGYVAIQTDVTERTLDKQRVTVLNRVLRHNLRNELNIIMGYVEEVQQSVPDDDIVQDACRIIFETCERLLSKSTKVRTLQQTLDRGSRTPQTIEDVLRKLQDVTPCRSGITLEISPERELEGAVADIVEIALLELVENACEHGASSTVRVMVTEVDEAHYEFTIVDDGPGLPEVEQIVLEEGTETPLEHSQGVGLWMAYWIVRAAGGSLSYDDERAGGSAIVVDVPRFESVA